MSPPVPSTARLKAPKKPLLLNSLQSTAMGAWSNPQSRAHLPLNHSRGPEVEGSPEVGEAHPALSQRSRKKHLDVVRPQHDPSTEAVAQVDDGHAAAETDDVWEGHPQRNDEDLVGKKLSGLTSILRGGGERGTHALRWEGDP